MVTKEIKVSSVEEAKDEIVYLKKRYPRMVHLVKTKKGRLYVESQSAESYRNTVKNILRETPPYSVY